MANVNRPKALYMLLANFFFPEFKLAIRIHGRGVCVWGGGGGIEDDAFSVKSQSPMYVGSLRFK